MVFTCKAKRGANSRSAYDYLIFGMLAHKAITPGYGEGYYYIKAWNVRHYKD